MQKLKLILIPVVVVAAIIAMLIYNKSKMQVKSSADAKDLNYVSVEKVKKLNPDIDISFIGTVIANSDIMVVSETSGRITANFMNVGEYKAAGTILVQVDDEIKRATVMSAEANYEKTKKDFERLQTLYEQKSVTEVQLDQAKLGFQMADAQLIIAKRQLNDTKVTAPVGGTIAAKNVEVGSMLNPGTVICNLLDISRLKVKINIAEVDVFKLKNGDPVSVTSEVFPGVILSGNIETIGSKGDEAHTFPVEVRVINTNNQLKAGMFAKVKFNTLKKENILAIPRQALTGSIKEPKVFVVKDGKVMLRTLTLGSEFDTKVEVLGGVAEDEIIVVSGQNNLAEGMKVEVIQSK